MSLVEAAYTRRPAATPFARSAIQSEGTADLCASWRSGSRVIQENRVSIIHLVSTWGFSRTTRNPLTPQSWHFDEPDYKDYSPISRRYLQNSHALRTSLRLARTSAIYKRRWKDWWLG